MSRYVDLDERVTAQFYDEECEEWTMQTCTIADVLDSVCDEYTVLPPAQPERKKGKWINEGRIIRCNKCKIGYATVKGMKSALTYNFCPNCGADMRGEHDG